MTDPRLARLAQLVAGYSLDLQPGQVVRIDTATAGLPLATELYRAALAAGALPFVDVEVEALTEILIAEGNDRQLASVPPVAAAELDALDAIATVWAESNTRGLTGAPLAKHQRQIASKRELTKHRWERISAGELRWCGVQCPAPAHAQEAGMALAEYERFVFRACHVEDGDDPVAHWRSTSAGLEARAEQLGEARELRIAGPGTDLRLRVEGRRWEAADGRYNMPDGEVFTSPVENSAQGEIAFAYPAVYRGHEIDGIRLRFEDGAVTAAEASAGGDFLAALLELDPGARRLGEVAFGLNYEIDRFTRNILFDEKIGGTMHLALGSGFTELGGVNESALHLDLVCDLRGEGEVRADGELVWQAGRFLEP